MSIKQYIRKAGPIKALQWTGLNIDELDSIIPENKYLIRSDRSHYPR